MHSAKLAWNLKEVVSHRRHLQKVLGDGPRGPSKAERGKALSQELLDCSVKASHLQSLQGMVYIGVVCKVYKDFLLGLLWFHTGDHRIYFGITVCTLSIGQYGSQLAC